METVTLPSGKVMRKQPDGTWQGDDGTSMTDAQVRALVPAGDSDGVKDGTTKNFGTAADPDWRERSGGRWVPLDDVGVRAADPSQLLGANGYKWQSGQGGNALWTDPEGRTVTESAAVTRVQREGATAPKAVTADPNVMTAGQSAQIGLGYAQLAAQNERERAQLAAQTEKWALEAAQVEENLRFLREKQAYAEKNDMRIDARETAAQIATQQFQRDTLNENIRQANVRAMETQQAREMEAQQFNATGQQRAAEFNATNQRETQRANLEYADRRDQRLQQVNRDIGVLGQDAGDRGEFASYALANSGWGQANTGIGQGENFITNESVQPLEQSLLNRQGLQNSSPNPYTFTPIAFNPIAGGQPGPLTQASQAANVTGQPMVESNQREQQIYGTNAPTADQILEKAKASGWAQPEGYSGSGQGLIDQADLYLKQIARGERQAPAGQTREQANANMDKQGVPSWVPRFEDGGASVDQQVLEMLAAVLGMEPKAIAGEKGKANGETVYSNGDVVVVPDKGKGGKGKKMMATGGLSLDPNFLSTGFLTEASKKARQNTPYADGRALPSPVYASSPGFDPELAAFIDSIRALEQGVPVGYSQRLTAKYRPQGMAQQTVGRTG